MASKAALENLAVHEKGYRPHMADQPVQRDLRNRLRSRAKALGDSRDAKGEQSIRHLTELAAYEHWHRLLFTRFLTENHLLITDEENGSVPITLDECEELAPELGARDGFDLACRFASRILPGVFRRDDPVLDLPIALNDQVAMRNLLNSLPTECFQADDALGWTYQFWQAQRKKEVDASNKKIGAAELSPKTQLFTEDYMVEFLLHNTLGAWWAGKLGPVEADSEEEARLRAGLPARKDVPAIEWSYLRFIQDEKTAMWSPAAGTFDGWPREARLVTLLDPCMGSGHFLVFALPLLVRLRMEEEQLALTDAVVAVLKDNIHGLELDERCTQIAAFNVALTAWKLAGYQALPQLHLACSGLAPSATEAEWITLAGADGRLQNGMARLYRLFKDAPVLGSLINPRVFGENLIEADFHQLSPLLTTALLPEQGDAIELAVTAKGLGKAAELLSGHFTLITTNVPYLGYKKQEDALRDYCDRFHADSKSDLATCFLDRCLGFCSSGGSTALVTPQNWLFLGGYKEMRQRLLARFRWDCIVRLGAGAFETITGEIVNVALVGITQASPSIEATLGLDVSIARTPSEKSVALCKTAVDSISQQEQSNNPDARISAQSINLNITQLGDYAECYQGVVTGDLERFRVQFWETAFFGNVWRPFRTTVSAQGKFDGLDSVLRWENGSGQLHKYAELTRYQLHDMHESGNRAWSRIGIAVNRMGTFTATAYSGEIFDNNVAVVIPNRPSDLCALSAYCMAPGFYEMVRALDQSIKVTNRTLLKVPFDLKDWEEVATEKYPSGLPASFSSDPTQWLFDGHPKGSDQPLHVAVARLLGYQWPRQTGSSFTDCPALGPDGLEGLADEDGIVCLPAVNHEQPAANRLRSLLAAALGSFDEASLIAAAGLKGSKSKTLEEWLRDEFFEQHAKLFHDRPFIWHLWDGRPDGFHVLVNYHKLDHATLQKLTYSYLGDWIQDQARDAKDNKPGAAERLGAAQELQKRLAAILEGEAPLDIFVRWKPLKDQAEGWHPDLNDGLRQNIRPFLLAGDVGKRGAGLFRTIPLKLKDSDRGNEPQRPKEEYPWFWCEEEPGTDPAGGDAFVGTRWNNVHLTLAKKKGAKA
jgi:hypothetical protein